MFFSLLSIFPEQVSREIRVVPLPRPMVCSNQKVTVIIFYSKQGGTAVFVMSSLKPIYGFRDFFYFFRRNANETFFFNIGMSGF